ncbi:MAG TPA: thioredoxin-like domain-containing protein [Bacteroidales bacterium]|nr:thioredoxin-like domain-containing protein [Bacteroidales bacterium]
MRKFKLVIFISLIPTLIFGQLKSGYEISLTINGLRDSSVYLAYHLGDKQYISDTIKLDISGKAIIKGQEQLPQGIYMIVFPGRNYFEMLMSTDQIFSVSCNYKDYFNTLKFDDSDENTSFIAYQKNWGKLQEQMSALVKRGQNNKDNKDSLNVINEAQVVQEKIMKDYLNSVINENKGNMLGTLVKAILPIEIPEFQITASTKNPDSLRWVLNYNYNKDHFFDGISLTDERLIRTPILHAKLNTFFTNVVIQAPDSINKEIDRIMVRCKDNYKVFQFVSVFLFNHFRTSEIMGHDAVMVKLADDIYLTNKADWVTKEFKDDLRKQIELIRPNLIGKKAQNLVMDSYKGIFVSLYDVNKEFTILYFWEPDCGHCKEATPKLKAYYEKAKNDNIEIFAVCTTAEKEKWSKYIEENQLTWINGWDPTRSSHFDYYYNIQSTPMVYILDRDKKIIAKKLSVENIGSFIDNYRKYFR